MARLCACTRMETCTSDKAAGVTPGRRLACPMVTGRTRSSVSRISRERPLMAPVLQPFGDRDAFRCLELFDRLALLIEVARKLDFRFDGTRRAPCLRAADRICCKPCKFRIGRKRRAQRAEHRLNADLGPLEQLCPGLSRCGGEFVAPAACNASAAALPVVSSRSSAAMRACFCSYSAQAWSLMRPRRRPCGVSGGRRYRCADAGGTPHAR